MELVPRLADSGRRPEGCNCTNEEVERAPIHQRHGTAVVFYGAYFAAAVVVAFLFDDLAERRVRQSQYRLKTTLKWMMSFLNRQSGYQICYWLQMLGSHIVCR